ncbi:ethanolamine utilization protein EutA [Streptomyces sp. NPDC005474]|uniref:helix-turn-helix transcriptional regulator n=1 Tax=Streptomyces sp. NPDC005474 TaxID=3154878 RepID=UPI0034541F80
MPARLLSIPAVAAALDVDRRTVYRFIAAGDLVRAENLVRAGHPACGRCQLPRHDDHSCSCVSPV